MQQREFKKYLSKRLIPGTVAVAVLISLVFPATYYLLQLRSLEAAAALHAQAFSEKLKDVIGNNPTLWKFQAQKYLQAVHEVTVYQNIAQLHVHDEKGEELTEFYFNTLEKDAPESGMYLIKGDASLNYNNKRIGTVEIYLSRRPLFKATFIILLLSLTTGITLSCFTYMMPIKVVGDADEELSTLLAGLENKVAERTEALKMASERLQFLVVSAPSVIYSAKAYGDFGATFISDNVQEIIGYEPWQFVEDSEFWMKNIHPEDKEKVFAELGHVFEVGSHIHEYRFLQKNGTYRWMHDEMRLIRDDDGNPKEFVGYWIDITERKKMEEVLQESEEKFRAIFDGAGDGILLADPESRKLLTGNATICRMLGYSVEELSSLGIQDTHPEEELPYVMEQFMRSLKGEIALATNIPVKRKDGTVFYADISGTPTTIAGKQYFAGFFRDVTERKLMEGTLQHSENKFRTLYESATDAIMMLDENGFFDCNKITLEMFGIATKEEFTRLHPSQISPQYQPDGLDSLTASNNRIAAAFENGSNFFEWVHRRANGENFFADVLLTALIIDGKPVLQATVRDISERKKAEDEILRLNESLEQKVIERTRQLEESNRELESFAYVVSHDLKAPLRAITSLSNWLAADYMDKLDEEGKETLNLLVQRSMRMNGLIDGILNYSRVGRISEESTSVDIAVLVNEVIQILAPPEGVAVTIETPLPTVVCEKTRIYQLFQNLISNAVKHLDKPNGEIRVGCLDEVPGANGKKTKGKKQVYAFYVSDNGPGIEEKYFDKIFQMFQTLRPRDEVENTGVGLTIAKKIVEMYGGAIWVESKIGEGATFWFTLPYSATEGAEGGGDTLLAPSDASQGGGGGR